MTQNRTAFLTTIAHSEGTLIPGSDNGYNVLVGDTFFDGYEDHPRISVHIPIIHNFSTAAGRYQILARNFDAYKKLLDLPDFSPASQDAIALQMIKECRALGAVDAGDIDTAVKLCAHIWASLPGAGYGQHEQKMPALRGWFMQAGGQLKSVTTEPYVTA